jgi:hypothetical protein
MPSLRRGTGTHADLLVGPHDWTALASPRWSLQGIGEISMTEKVLAALDAITARVLSYRPKDKGLAAKKTERRLKRQAKKEAHDDRESSI